MNLHFLSKVEPVIQDEARWLVPSIALASASLIKYPRIATIGFLFGILAPSLARNGSDIVDCTMRTFWNFRNPRRVLLAALGAGLAMTCDVSKIVTFATVIFAAKTGAELAYLRAPNP